jgi:two-component sensor histidine kinase
MRTAVTDPSVHYRDIVNSLPSAMLVLDGTLTVQYANLAYFQLFGGTEEGTLGHSVFAVQDAIWNEPQLRALLEAVLPHDVAINGFTLEQTFPVIGARILNLSARRVDRDGAPTEQVLIGIEDVTNAAMARRAAEETLNKSHAMMTEIHHRVKNNIASILSMLRIEGRALEHQGAKDVLGRISLRVESMGSLYELLAVNENTGLVKLMPYFERVCRSIEQMAGSHHLGWSIDVKGEDVAVSVDDAIQIGAVVNELVANAAKYAFDGSQDIGRIRINLYERGSDMNITVSDNGVGFDQEHMDPKSTGLGMRLVDMYLAALGGSVERESGPKGTTCFIRIPNRKKTDALASSGTHVVLQPRPAAVMRKSAHGRTRDVPGTAVKIAAAPNAD